MNGALCWDCNIIISLFIYLQCKIVGCQQTEANGGSWVPQNQISMPRSRLADRLCDTWRDMTEQIGSSMWFGLSFTFHPTVFSAGLGADFEFDLKRIIILSTFRQLGLRITTIYIGLFGLACFHPLTHALFKALLCHLYWLMCVYGKYVSKWHT